MAAPEAGKNWVVGLIRIVLVAGTVLVLVLTGLLLYREKGWAQPEFLGPREAFFDRTIGTEVIPLPVLQVLPELTRERKHFAPLGPDAGDWIEQFGFLRSKESKDLPVGFTLSHYRPRSGAPSPVPFVGIGCATCHSSEIVRPDGTRFFVTGTGNTSLNLFAWLDALQAALLDKDGDAFVVTVPSIRAAYQQKYGRDLGFEEVLMTGLWLRGFRQTLQEGLPRFDDPYGHGQSLSVAAAPTGPGRTQPFRTLVRNVLLRPGTSMQVYTKIAPVYHEDWQEWAQVDGGIRGLNYRSALAVLAAGATVENMTVPEITHNVIAATDFVRTLRGPTYARVFPGRQPAAPVVERGRAVYRKHCHHCHGSPGEGDTWVNGKRHGEVVPVEEIGTDPQRVVFRHFDELPDKLFEHFPDKHPFKFPREDLRPGPAGTVKGYINKPIDSVFSRAPYLHNASVLTLAELINLEPRRQVFYRGRNTYDPERLGLRSPDRPDRNHYFRFDTSAPGNSNGGHDYPWPYRKGAWNEKDLRDLLEYLKTI
jgi:hypothetical protein